jgi:1,4-alpha-glucan branching enzyme
MFRSPLSYMCVSETIALTSQAYGGSGMGNCGGSQAHEYSWHGRPHCLELTLPPLGMIFLRSTVTG